MKITMTRDLEALRAAAERKIDQRAEAIRQIFITPGSGQAMVYAAKQEEARRWLAEQPAETTPDQYPLLLAEAGLTAPTVAELAALWRGMEIQWLQAAAMIEAKRMAAKAAVRAATTPAAIEAASNADLMPGQG